MGPNSSVYYDEQNRPRALRSGDVIINEDNNNNTYSEYNPEKEDPEVIPFKGSPT